MEFQVNGLTSLPDSSLCQNGKQVEIITKMIFELCYIEAISAYLHTAHAMSEMCFCPSCTLIAPPCLFL